MSKHPHCLISARDIFFLFSIPPSSFFPPLQHLFGTIPLCQVPLRMSRGIFVFQVTDANSPCEMGGSSPMADFLHVSSFEPWRSSYVFSELKLNAWQPTVTSLSAEMIRSTAQEMSKKGYHTSQKSWIDQ